MDLSKSGIIIAAVVLGILFLPKIVHEIGVFPLLLAAGAGLYLWRKLD